MQVIRNYSNQSLLGNLLGTLIGANYQQKDEDKRFNQMIALKEYETATQEGFLRDNPDLANALQNPNLTDEDWDNLGNKHGFDVSQIKGVNNFYRDISQEGLNWQNATDDTGRQEAAQKGEELRRQFAEKFGIPLKGMSKDDIITEETLKQNLSPLLNIENLYKNNKRQKYLKRGGNPKLLDLIGF